MDTDEVEYVSLVALGLVITADALLGLLRDGGQWSGVALAASLVVLGSAVVQLRNDTKESSSRLHPYVGILAFLLATVGFVLDLLDFVNV